MTDLLAKEDFDMREVLEMLDSADISTVSLSRTQGHLLGAALVDIGNGHFTPVPGACVMERPASQALWWLPAPDSVDPGGEHHHLQPAGPLGIPLPTGE
jgi:hypothetical protein